MSELELYNQKTFENIKHFADVGKTIKMPKNAEKIVDDIMLSRYACYLIVQNGDPRKKMIAFEKKYKRIEKKKKKLILLNQVLIRVIFLFGRVKSFRMVSNIMKFYIDFKRIIIPAITRMSK